MLILMLAGALMVQEPSKEESEILGLIQQLRETADGDMGYSSTTSGSKFSALEDQGQPGAMLLGQKGHRPSEPLKALVKKGAAAVPHLIAKLDDDTKTKITISGGFDGMFFEDEVDVNRRVRKDAPARDPAKWFDLHYAARYGDSGTAKRRWNGRPTTSAAKSPNCCEKTRLRAPASAVP